MRKKTIKTPFKRLILEKEDFRVGDIIITEEEGTYYKIIEIGETILHNHKYIKVRYADENVKVWLLEEMGKRKALRFQPYEQFK